MSNGGGGSQQGSSRCPYCEGAISPSAQKCRHCGEWIRRPAAPTPSPPQTAPLAQPFNYASGPPQTVQQNVVIKTPESSTFAVVTLLFFIFLYPVGLILNLVGLISGPRRGCFLSMLLFFVLLPVGIVVVLVLAGITVGVPEIDEFLRSLTDNGM